MDEASQSRPSDEVDYYGLQEAIGQEEEEDAEEIEAQMPPSHVEQPLISSKRKRTSQAPAQAPAQASAQEAPVEAQTGTTTKKPTRPPSWAWDHFSEKKIGDFNRAVCNWCGSNYACDRKKNGTSNMIGHLLRQCKKFPKDLRDPKQTILTLQPKKKEQGEGTGSSLTAVCFDNELCREALARMIIIDELPFRFVEGEGFRYYMSVVQPLFNVPSRFTVARDCYKLYITEKNRLKSILSKNMQYVSLTTDCWTSVQNLNYMCLTAHFIDGDWNYQKRIINFCQIPDHKGDTIGKVIEKKLLEWKIEKVFSITVDNASSNDVAITYLKRRINAWKESVLKCELLHMRCCAHILNLIVMDGLKEVHDSVVKIRNAVRYVRSSPSRLQKFKTCAEDEKIQSKSFVSLDVCTRWNSTYLMLESALKFQSAFDRLEDTSGDYSLYFVGGSERKTGPPRFDDWEIASKFVKFLKIFYEATLNISASTHATSHLYFHDFGTILNALNSWCESDDLVFKSMAQKMNNKFDKYWGDLQNVNLIIFIACVLDPRYKMKYVEFASARLYDISTSNALSARVKETFFRLFDHYRLAFGESEQNINSTSQSHAYHSEEGNDNDDKYKMTDIFVDEMSKEDKLESKTEVEIYLAEAREKKSDKFDILNWWKVNSSKYPILSLIARDVLAIPMSTVASESAFSTGGRVLDPYRSSLSPRMVEALICAQNWYRSSPLPCDMEPPDEAEAIDKEINKVCGAIGELEI